MLNHTVHPAHWATAALGQSPDLSPADSEALGEHLHHCGAVRGRWHTLSEGAQTLRSVMGSHVVTTTALVLTGLVLLAWLWR